MDKLLAKLDPDDVKTLLELVKVSNAAEKHQPSVKLDLPPVDLKLDGPATYLSWSRRIQGALAGRNLEGFLTGERKEPEQNTDAWNEWKTTHMLLYTWLLNSMVPSIAVTVDGIQNVKDMWMKLKRIYAGTENNMRVFQIEREIEAVVQGDRSIQEYATDLERLWADYDYFSPMACCKDPECRRGERDAQRRTMHFLRRLNPAFEHRTAVLLAQTRIPSLDEAIAAMMQEESRIKLLSEANGVGVRSALTVSNSSMAGVQGETRKCYNCGEVGHLRTACPKPLKERDFGGRGQSGGRGRGRGRGGRRGGRGGYRANLMVAEEEEDTGVVFTEEDQALLDVLSRKQKAASNGDKKSVTEDASTSFLPRGNIATYAHSTQGTSNTHALASLSTNRSPEWIVDSGASRHVTGNISEFSSYTHLAMPECIQTADGTTQPVVGKGTVNCTGSVTLSNVLHAPSFPVNLLSISAIILQLKCVVSFDIPKVIFQEKGTGRRLGTGTWRSGLWYLDREGLDSALISMVEGTEKMGSEMNVEDVLMLHHQRMGHSSFNVLSRLYPVLFEKANKLKLVCDACEFGKLTRSSYVSSGHRSSCAFDLIHSDVWGPCPTSSMNGYRYFVTFIDCFSRVTWLYLMKNKNEVLACFKDFHRSVQTQYGAVVKILRSDNGTEYTNRAFAEYLSAQGIQHQTTCPYTPAQNGVAERKNRHLLEVARSMMISMNVPKYLWGQAVLTAAALINRMPSRVLEWKSPCEMLKGDNAGILPLKVFGCVCFVKDNRPSVGKLDPRAVKCIFVGYSATQKGYVCWSPVEKRLFVSMDVHFREFEPYYTLEVTSPFGDLSDSERMRQEGENCDKMGTMEPIPLSIPTLVQAHENGEEGEEDEQEEEGVLDHPANVIPAQHELKVYTRRPKEGPTNAPIIPLVPSSPLSRPVPTLETATPTQSTDSEFTGDMNHLSSLHTPITLRRTSRSNAGLPPDRYGFPHDIAQFVSYSNISPVHGAFIASLDSVTLPKCWQDAKKDPKWKAAMQEELGALDKNKTWEIVSLPPGKKAVGCRWVFTVKQTPEGKIDRYKARLVAKGYSQTYGIDYDETFAPVAKMSTVRTLVSLAANEGWKLHQLDVKNAFLHGDLLEEVYMEIPPGFGTAQTIGKVCRLRKSLYGLKQSPRAWFDRFRRAMVGMGYRQINADHTVFIRHHKGHCTMLAVYVDDIIITGDDEKEIAQLKVQLGKVFEVKDLGLLRYFLGIEVARGAEGIVLSQRKYVLDLLKETGMLGCKPAVTPIDSKLKLSAEEGESVDRERYQRLVGRLIYLNHTRPDISFAVSVVSRYMHDPRKGHMDAVYRILRYLKSAPGKGLIFRKNDHLNIEGYCDSDWASCVDDRRSTSGYCVFVGGNLVSWRSKKQSVVARSTAEAEYRAMASGVAELLWLRGLLRELKMGQGDQMKLWCDNKSAISIANNPVQHDRTKHIEIDRFFIKEKLDS
ncbi:Transposon Ty1-H Gag-Pol polyprotein [Rhynchospora pubera]|uniref:Transposon Ty1-H Gag-Pol polyprotein n=1 Tax=Rhynchospora pubera TaxID=906938 RepID=A0AAV8B3Z5_9POAL|nr:Transposon Ty1-H Gag-Pol polyprotein [Rhynchospora pubera]